MSVRTLLMTVVLAVCLGLIVLKGAKLLADPTVMPPDDFVEYYAAGKLNARGQNPYDGDLLLPIERDAGRDTDEPIMMWNPPWTLTVAMPIGLLPARPAQMLWLAVSLGLILLSVDRLWFLYGGDPSRRWVSWLLALTFLPTLFVLQSGQIGAFILAGLAGFLIADRNRWHWLAGACGVLVAIKPHLVYLFWIALAVWAVRRPAGRWQVIAGGVVVGIIATAIPLATNPDVLTQYWEAMTHRTPEQWKSPTIGSYLREAFGEDRFGLQFVPTILGVAWLICDWLTKRHRPFEWAERLPMILLVSFATASYGAWPFDLVILLPAVIHVAATIRGHRIWFALAAWVAINAAALGSNITGLTSDTFVWMSPSLLLAYVLLRPRP